MSIAPDLDKTRPLKAAVDEASTLKGGFRLAFSGLYGSSRAYFLSKVFKSSGRPVLAVLPTEEAAEDFAGDLKFFLGDEAVRLYPSIEVLPFETQPPHPEIQARRMEVLDRLLGPGPSVTVSSAANLMQKVPPRSILSEKALTLKVGEEYPRDELLLQLQEMGYSRMSIVEERGEMSSRGGILDVFPPMHGSPLRIDFFGDEVETIKAFDISTQRSVKDLQEARILPAREAVLTREARARARERLIERAESLELRREEWEPLSDRLREGTLLQGSNTLLPLFYERLDTVFDYLAVDTIIALVDPAFVGQGLDEFEREVASARDRLTENKKFFVEPGGLYLSPEEVKGYFGKGALIEVETLNTGGSVIEVESNLGLRQEMASRKGEFILAPLAERIKGRIDEGYSVYITAHNKGQAERTLELLSGYGIKAAVVKGVDVAGGGTLRVYVATGSLSTGFTIPTELVSIISEEEVFGERVKRRAPPSRKLESFLTQLQDLSEGDFIVHALHGVGLYRGLKRLSIDGVENDFLLLEYRGGDKLYLPVWRMDLVSKYHGVEGISPELDKLGGQGWAKTKKKVRESVERLAGELLKLYAERQVSEGFAFSEPGPMFREFESSFEYEETPDQARAIEDCMADMGKPRPMDRLICGDVGYGKTEVAMRAALRAVLDGKQVAVLVPTTVLAQQHYSTFRRRFAPYPVRVEVLSRFRSKKEQTGVTAGVASGEVDIVIGTHRLLQGDVSFKDLGLIVIDEEHRFGVAYKERLKKLRKKVDVLTLTATPIPRTLHMSLAGIRELSIINTPPEDRLAIKTSVIRFDEEVVAEAVERELARGGQVFFVHNRIQTMGAVEESLRRVCPRARIAVAHGQMKESELEKKMLGFVNREYDILLSTAIIESGLDIPSANTIIINRADRFGLAELYQLRGRVGRSSHRAYAYFICPDMTELTDDARKRIEVLQELTEPGSGFKIASYDLEIRGAGELLGTEQSGQIAEVGFDMYCQLLDEAVSTLRGEAPEEEFSPEINLRVSQYIPEEYIPDTRQRLGFYKRLASVGSNEELSSIVDELSDRYGEVPSIAKNLIGVMELKLLLRRLRIKELTQKGTRLYLAFGDEADKAAAREEKGKAVDNALRLVTQEPKRFRVTPDSRLVVYMAPEASPMEEARYVLKELSKGCYI